MKLMSALPIPFFILESDLDKTISNVISTIDTYIQANPNWYKETYTGRYGTNLDIVAWLTNMMTEMYFNQYSVTRTYFITIISYLNNLKLKTFLNENN